MQQFMFHFHGTSHLSQYENWKQVNMHVNLKHKTDNICEVFNNKFYSFNRKSCVLLVIHVITMSW